MDALEFFSDIVHLFKMVHYGVVTDTELDQVAVDMSANG